MAFTPLSWLLQLIIVAAVVAAPMHHTLVAAPSSLRQIIDPHLTLTGVPTEMIISWSVLDSTQKNTTVPPTPSATFSMVRWGFAPDDLRHTVTNATTTMTSLTENLATYDYCGIVTETRTLHQVKLTQLPVDATVYYQASIMAPRPYADTLWATTATAAVASFHTPPLDGSSTLRFLATADMCDAVRADYTAIPQMIGAVHNATPEAPIALGLHIGDIAYNLDLPPNGDNYMSNMSRMARSVPWMYAPGNHEADCNYTYQNYKGRFAAQNETRSLNGPHSGSSRWYSFDLGPVHFITIDTDAYGFDEVAYILQDQYSWLESDLAAVNRSRTSWVILMGHRPMYCSSASMGTSHLGWPKRPEGIPRGTPPPKGYGAGFHAVGVEPPIWEGREDDDAPFQCGVGDLMRNGMIAHAPATGRRFGLEPLMKRFGVDMYLAGHEHNYERLWPIMNGTWTTSYAAPGKPVHVVTGAGGAYGKDPFGPPVPWDAFRSGEWSYSDIVANRTHIIFKQKLATNSSLLDSFVLTR